MSAKIQRWTSKHRVASILLLALLLATAALTARQVGRAITQPAPGTAVDQPQSAAVRLAAPVPPAAATFIQRTSSPYGNVLLTVQLTQAELDAKKLDGTSDFVTIGDASAPVLLRDDGQGGDTAAGDGIFTGVAAIDEAELTARDQSDRNAISANQGAPVPTFSGRVSGASASPAPFDLTGFNAGRAVRFEPPVTYLTTATSSFSGGTVPPVPSHIQNGLVAKAVVLGTNQFQDRVLMIRDINVVQDPTRTYNPCTDTGNSSGVWTFNHLITEMANQAATGVDAPTFAEDWLKNWTVVQTINTHPVPARGAMTTQILNNWPRINGKLDLTKSPLRLLAIDPRIDLRTTTTGAGGYAGNAGGNFLDAGEARFIFGFVANANSPNCAPRPFSVIFEFRVHKCSCEGVRDWAKAWKNLNNFVPGSATYNALLENLTEQFVKANSNPARPNGSSIGQVRSNEIALAAPWELREFQLPQFPFSAKLFESTANDTAIDTFNNTVTFKNWVLGLNPAAPARVPLIFQTLNFQGSNPQMPSPAFFWNAPGLVVGDNPKRFTASLDACNGCHARETGTVFVHVDPSTPLNNPATLSGFLTGITVNDPAFAGITHDFDDLARREIDIMQVAGMTCAKLQPINVAVVKASLISVGKLPPDIFGGDPPLPPDLLVSVGVSDLRRNVVPQVH
jgi:hypothetical protein